MFKESWNNHSISTENNRTPNQLFIHGALQNSMVPRQPNVTAVPAAHAIQTAPASHVRVAQIAFQPCVLLSTLLQTTVNPLGQSNSFGHDMYLQCVNIVGHHLLHDCINNKIKFFSF